MRVARNKRYISNGRVACPAFASRARTDGKNAGKGTIKAPFPSNPDLRVWIGRLPKSELDELVLANNVSLSPQGYLSKDSIDVAHARKIRSRKE